jgi:hypothetical protein
MMFGTRIVTPRAGSGSIEKLHGGSGQPPPWRML